MSPPADQPWRRPTLPPPRPPSTDERLTRAETLIDVIVQDFDELKAETRKQTETFEAGLATANASLASLVAARTAAQKHKDFWMKVLVGVLTAALIGAGTWLAAIVNSVQHARLTP